MAYQRGNQEDYDIWETEFGAKGWNFENVLKLFKEDENIDDPFLSGRFLILSIIIRITMIINVIIIMNIII